MVTALSIGKRIRSARESAGIQQQDLAKRINVQRVKMTYIENGTRLPSAVDLEAISKELEVSTDWILGLTNVKSVSPDSFELKGFCKYTGLSETAAQALHEDKDNLFNYGNVQAINDLLEDEYRLLLSLLFRIFRGEIVMEEGQEIGLSCDGDEHIQLLTEDSVIKLFLDEIDDTILSMRKMLRRKKYEGPIPKDNP